MPGSPAITHVTNEPRPGRSELRFLRLARGNCYPSGQVGVGSARPAFLCVCTRTRERTRLADGKPARSQGPQGRADEDKDASAPWRSAEAGRLHARVYGHAEEAELGASEGCARAPDERDGGHHLHSGRGPQPPGAFCGADPRRSRQGHAGRPLQGDPRRARHGRRVGPPARSFEVRRQAGELVVPRRAEVPVRTLDPDPVHNSQLVTQLVNRVMTRGKKSTAERIVYGALDRVGEKTGRPPADVLRSEEHTSELQSRQYLVC